MAARQIDCYGFETTSEYFKLKKIDTSGDSSGSARYRIVTRVPCRMKVGPSSDTSRVTVGFNDKTHCPDWTVHRLRAEQLSGAKVKRTDDFRHDAQIPRSAELSDYKGSGWHSFNGRGRPGKGCPHPTPHWSSRPGKKVD